MNTQRCRLILKSFIASSISLYMQNDYDILFPMFSACLLPEYEVLAG